MKLLTESILKINNLSPLPERVEGGYLPARITGLSSIHRVHLAAAMKLQTKRPLIMICPDETAAEYAASNLKIFLETDVPILTGREFVFYDTNTVSRQTEQARLAALDAFLNDNLSAAVVTVSALLMRTIPPEKLEQTSFSICKGETIAPEDLEDALLRAGYIPSDMIEGIGQFSRRGGIIDIFSPAYKKPIRLDFWGDEVDRLTLFDVNSQRSEEEIEKARIIPAAETLPSVMTGGKATLIKKLENLSEKVNLNSEKFNAEKLKNNLEKDAQTLKNQQLLPTADRYMALVYDRFCTGMDYFPADALIVVDSAGKCSEKTKTLLKQNTDDLKQLIENGTLSKKYSEYYVSQKEIEIRLTDYATILADALTISKSTIPLKTDIGIQAKQLPSYGGSAEAASQDVLHWISQDYRCVVLTGDLRRAEAMKEILISHGIEKVYIDERLQCIPERGKCVITVGSLSSGFEYPQIHLAVITDTQILKVTENKIKKRNGKNRGAKIGSYEDLSVGDLVVHDIHGIGRFAGIFKMPVDGAVKDYIKINFAGADSLYVPAMQLDMVTKYIGAGEDHPVKLSKLGGTDWIRAKSRAKAAAKEMAGELIQLYAERQNTPGFAFSPDSPWQTEFEESFEYNETDDQLRCIEEIKRDMEKPIPMDRILCGDVGYGKTEVALRAIMKCVLDGKQAAILVPTTVLAKQHYQTAISRFFGFPVNIKQVSRFEESSHIKKTLQELENGTCDIIIGTHRLLQKDIHFKNLGLLVVDEEQRFGVGHKEHIKEMAKNVDVLTLSATPIPRTLNMALAGIRDMSTIETPPSDRMPVQTYVMEHDWDILCDAIRKEISRGGQVYYLHNRIDTIERTVSTLKKHLPEVNISVAHGRMDEKELSSVMESMTSGEISVLVCTTIIETGIDIPNVNTLIIEDADKLGLAQLHQIRGRVGRSSRSAAAYLTFRKNKELTEIAEKRLEAIRDFAEFNAGIRIAMRDLEIRGAGNLLGSQQSGHMIDVGYDMYLKLLEEAVQEEKGEPLPPRTECSADISVSASIPEEYVHAAEQRMDLYRRIALIKNEDDADDITAELVDRYGDPPKEVNTLIQIALVRAKASEQGVTEITQKNGVLQFKFDKFNFECISDMLSEDKWKGRIKVVPGEKPVVAIKLLSKQRTLEEARNFINRYALNISNIQ